MTLLATNLQQAAAAITENDHDHLPLWLLSGPDQQGGLVHLVLGIIRTLPNGLSRFAAASTCAAAAAVLANILHVARHHHGQSRAPGSPDTLSASLAAQIVNMSTLQTIVGIGMLDAPALLPLPPAFAIHIEPAAAAGVLHDNRFWTPLRVCGYLLAEMMLADDKASSGEARHFDKIRHVMGKLAEVQVTQHLLRTALVDPAAEMPWLVMAAVMQSNPEAATHCLQQLVPLVQQVMRQLQAKKEQLGVAAASAREECWWLFAVAVKHIHLAEDLEEHLLSAAAGEGRAPGMGTEERAHLDSRNQVLQEDEEKQTAEMSSYTQQLLEQLASAELKLQQSAEPMTQLQASHEESIARLRVEQQQAEVIAKSREQQLEAARAQVALHHRALDNKDKVIAAKDAALKARSQTLLNAMEHAEHWKQRAGEWQQLAEQSAEEVRALRELTQPGAAHGKDLQKMMKDVEDRLPGMERRRSDGDTHGLVTDQGDGGATGTDKMALGAGDGVLRRPAGAASADAAAAAATAAAAAHDAYVNWSTHHALAAARFKNLLLVAAGLLLSWAAQLCLNIRFHGKS